MRELPKRFTHHWWKLWRSGAIPKDNVFFSELAQLVLDRRETNPHYYGDEDVRTIRKGLGTQDIKRQTTRLSGMWLGTR